MWAAGNLQNNLKGTFRFIKDEAHRSESECLLKTVEVQKYFMLVRQISLSKVNC